MTAVAFLGLGAIGDPMARQIAQEAHFTLAVWNRTAKKAADFAAKHRARHAESPADAARGASVVVPCLPTSADVEALLEGPNGLEAGFADGGFDVVYMRDVFEHVPLDGVSWVVSTAPDLDTSRTLLHTLRERHYGGSVAVARVVASLFATISRYCCRNRPLRSMTWSGVSSTMSIVARGVRSLSVAMRRNMPVAATEGYRRTLSLRASPRARRAPGGRLHTPRSGGPAGAGAGGGGSSYSFATISNTATALVANTSNTRLTIVGESGIAVAMNSTINQITVAANYIGAQGLTVDYGYVTEPAYYGFDYGYLS